MQPGCEPPSAKTHSNVSHSNMPEPPMPGTEGTQNQRATTGASKAVGQGPSGRSDTQMGRRGPGLRPREGRDQH